MHLIDCLIVFKLSSKISSYLNKYAESLRNKEPKKSFGFVGLWSTAFVAVAFWRFLLVTKRIQKRTTMARISKFRPKIIRHFCLLNQTNWIQIDKTFTHKYYFLPFLVPFVLVKNWLLLAYWMTFHDLEWKKYL